MTRNLVQVPAFHDSLQVPRGKQTWMDNPQLFLDHSLMSLMAIMFIYGFYMLISNGYLYICIYIYTHFTHENSPPMSKQRKQEQQEKKQQQQDSDQKVLYS